MSLESARKQFLENRDLFGNDPKTKTENFNFYNGLANLTEGLIQIRDSLQKIETYLQQKDKKF